MKKVLKHFGIDISKLTLLGRGYEGRVYLLPNDRVIKIFHSHTSCRNQTEILLKVKDSRFFPRIYKYDDYSIIMSLVYGDTLSHYLKRNALDKRLSLELVHLIEEFRNYRFTRLDMRLEHIFIQPDYSIKAIDPRGSYTFNQPYPKQMLKGLKERNVVRDFFNHIKEEYPDYYKYWSNSHF